MIYAVINRTAGTATVTDDSSTLPTVTSADQEVFLIAKRMDSGTVLKDYTSEMDRHLMKDRLQD